MQGLEGITEQMRSERKQSNGGTRPRRHQALKRGVVSAEVGEPPKVVTSMPPTPHLEHYVILLVLSLMEMARVLYRY